MTLEQQIEQAEKHLKNLKAQLAQVNTLRSYFGDEYKSYVDFEQTELMFKGQGKGGHTFSLIYLVGDDHIEILDKENYLPDVDKDTHGVGFIPLKDIKKYFRRSR